MRDSDLILKYSTVVILLLVKELVREGRELSLLSCKKTENIILKLISWFSWLDS